MIQSTGIRQQEQVAKLPRNVALKIQYTFHFVNPMPTMQVLHVRNTKFEILSAKSEAELTSERFQGRMEYTLMLQSNEPVKAISPVATKLDILPVFAIVLTHFRELISHTYLQRNHQESSKIQIFSNLQCLVASTTKK